jgi:hypothetical protein
MEDVRNIIRQQADEALSKLGAQGIVTPEYVADCVVRQTAYWEKALGDSQKLLFVRLSSPVVQREEVFLGCILFNGFLSRSLSRTVVQGAMGRAQPVANDLENYYLLVRTTLDIGRLVEAFRSECQRCLPDLFFGEQDEDKAIYGDLSRMFTFRKSEFEPFPVYAVPQFLASQLEQAVHRVVNSLLTPAMFPDHVRTVLAAVAFFYGRTSGGRGDAQSPATFITRLAKQKEYDKLLKPADVKKAFNVRVLNKAGIKQSIDEGTYSTKALRDLLSNLVRALHASVRRGSTKWLMPFLHKDKKFLEVSPAAYMDHVLRYIQVGFNALTRAGHADDRRLRCTTCGSCMSMAKSSMSLMGTGAFDRHNQSIRQPNKETPRVCARCALYSYLSQKLLGTEPRSIGGRPPKYAQVPKGHNLVLHYGRHDDGEVVGVVHALDLIWSLVHEHRDARQVRSGAERQLREMKAKREREPDSRKQQTLAEDEAQKEMELQRAESRLRKAEEDIFAAHPWLRGADGSLDTLEIPSLDFLANIQLSETKVERHVLGLGMGGYRMILFVLPQIRAPRDAKQHDFAQRRFSDSRLLVTAVLSFLRELCGCDGPFYYQSLPTLIPESFRRDTFYVRDEPITVQEAQKEYEAVTQLAWRLVGRRKPTESGPELFVRKVLLAEQLLADPLAGFSAVMRDSPILGAQPKKAQFKALPGGYRRDWGAQDLTEYGKFIQRLLRLQEVNWHGTAC